MIDRMKILIILKEHCEKEYLLENKGELVSTLALETLQEQKTENKKHKEPTVRTKHTHNELIVRTRREVVP